MSETEQQNGMACPGCRDGAEVGFAFSMAFQPIVDVLEEKPFAFEALVRGEHGESAASVLGKVSDANRYAFDQQCRVKALEVSSRAGLRESGARLSINFLPNAIYSPAACIQLTLKTARKLDFPQDRLIFEFTENEEMPDPEHVVRIVDTYRRMGFGTALDDFGAGHSGLNLLARLQTDLVKLDMGLVRGVDASRPRQVIVDAVMKMCGALGIDVIAEGIETAEEVAALRAIGVRYMQGYYFARPGFEVLPTVSFTALAA